MKRKGMLRIGALSLACLDLFFMLAVGVFSGSKYFSPDANASGTAYSHTYAEDFSTKTYMDSINANTTLSWGTNGSGLVLPWDLNKIKTSARAASTKINAGSDYVSEAKIVGLSNYDNRSCYGIMYGLSNDGGNSWVTFNDSGDDHSVKFNNLGNDLRWKVDVANNCLDNPSSPTINSITVYYNTVPSTPALSLSLIPNTIASVEKGATNVQLISIKIANTGNEDLAFAPFGIAIQGVDGNSNFIDYISNTAFYVNGVRLDRAVQTKSFPVAYLTGLSTNPVKLEKGKSMIFTAKGDIVSTIDRNSLTFLAHYANNNGFTDMIMAKGSTSGKTATITSGDVKSTLNIGTAINLVTSLTASIIPNTVTSVEKGATNVQLISVKLTNTGNEDLNLSEIFLPTGGYIYPGAENTILYIDNTKIGSPSLIDSYAQYVDYKNLNLNIPKGASTTLTLVGNISNTTTQNELDFYIYDYYFLAKGISGGSAKVTIQGSDKVVLNIKSIPVANAFGINKIQKNVTAKSGDKNVVLQEIKISNETNKNAYLHIKSFKFTKENRHPVDLKADFDAIYLSQGNVIFKGTIVGDEVKFDKAFGFQPGSSGTVILKGDTSSSAIGIEIINLFMDSNIIDANGSVLYDASDFIPNRSFPVNSFGAYATVYLNQEIVTPAPAPTPTPAPVCTMDSNIKEGGMIRLHGGIDVYIVKYKNCKKFKRLILSPSVFKSYGHLKWNDIVNVDGSTFDTFATSDYVYVSGDSRIWKLTPSGDRGSKAQVTFGYDPDGAYEINATDRDSYRD